MHLQKHVPTISLLSGNRYRRVDLCSESSTTWTCSNISISEHELKGTSISSTIQITWLSSIFGNAQTCNGTCKISENEHCFCYLYCILMSCFDVYGRSLSCLFSVFFSRLDCLYCTKKGTVSTLLPWYKQYRAVGCELYSFRPINPTFTIVDGFNHLRV